jgi:hypothetical protein
MTAVKPDTRNRESAAARDSARGPGPVGDVLDSWPPRMSAPALVMFVRALFKEAWRRRRRRRLAAVVVAMLAAGAAIGVSTTVWQVTPGPGHAATGGRGTGGVAGSPGGAALPPVAWVDGSGLLRIGDLATGSQRVAAGTGAVPQADTPLVSAGGRVYWIDTGGMSLRGYGYWPDVARALDVATGKVQNLAPGQAVFASADGRHVFVAWTGTDVIELPAAGRGPSRQLAVPHGWYVPDGGPGPFDPPLAVAGDIVVQGSSFQNNPHPTRVGIWNLRTGKVTVLGRVVSANFGLIGAVALPGSGRGLVAWIPASCGQRSGWRCIEITDTATLSSETVRSPSPGGFALGGAFSTDGRWLAAFVNTGQGRGAVARPSLINTHSGALRVVAGAPFTAGQDILWARALPGGSEFLTGGTASTYLVTAVPLSARPLGSTGLDLNYSVVVLPAGGR